RQHVKEILSALGREQDALTKSRESEELSRQRLIRQYVANGQRFVDKGEPLGGLPWFVEALALETDAASQTVHRRRIGLILRQSPRLEHLLRHDGGLRAAEFSPDGKWIATGGVAADGKTSEVQIWDVTTGDPAFPALQYDPPEAGDGIIGVGQIAFSRDGQLLAAANNLRVCV